LEAPVLQHFDPNRPTWVITNGSDFALSGIVHQKDDSARLHPVAYYSRKMTPAEMNYDAGDKEALAIVETFRNFRSWLVGSPFVVTLLSDHLNLAPLMTTKTLNRRQIRWAQFLADYHFVFAHIPGIHNPADAPSHRPDYVPKEGDEHITQQTTNLFNPSSYAHLFTTPTESRSTSPSDIGTTANALFTLPHSDLAARIKTAQADDQEWKDQVELLNKRFTLDNDNVLYDNRVYIPNALRLEVLKSHHDNPTAGHPGRAVTLDLIRRNYSWPGIQRLVRTYVTSCDICQRVKADRHKPYGLLNPLPVPQRPWESLSWDFVVKLPVSSGFDSIWVIVDRLTKGAHFVPCKESMDAHALSKLFLKEVYRIHGAPKDVVSDRGPTLVSAVFKAFLKKLGCTVKATSAYHPQGDGQTERVNQPIEDFLRCFVSYQQDDWSELLPLAEFAYNNHVHSSTHNSPFFVTYGFHPHPEPTIASNGAVPSVDRHVEQLQTIRAELQAEIRHAQEDYTRHYNKYVQDNPESFKPGELVWLRRRNIKTKRPSDKLDYRKIGPFPIKCAHGSVAFELVLPPNLARLHPTFHVSLLEPYHDPSQVPGRVAPPPPPLHIDDGDVPWLEVSDILDCRRVGRRLEYLVRWKGLTPNDDSFVPLSDLSTELDEDLERFHRRHPTLPKPTRAELDINADNPRARYAPPSKTTTRSGRTSKPRGAQP
jgi:hypothetical protein